MNPRSLSPLLAAALSLAATASPSPTPEDKSPAQWVAQLGADHLWDRDAASAHLLTLGSASRPAVEAALNSPDPEIRYRARDLWQTLRWQVVPGAEADVPTLVNDVMTPANDPKWDDFVTKHGAATLALIAELQKAGVDDHRVDPGLNSLLAKVHDDDIVRFIQSASADGASFRILLNEFSGRQVSLSSGVCLVDIDLGLGEFERSFRLGHDLTLRFQDADEFDVDQTIIKLCTSAAQGGGLAPKLGKWASDAIQGQASDPSKQCAELTFYASVFAGLKHADRIPALYGMASGVGQAKDQVKASLVGVLRTERFPKLALKTLAGAAAPIPLYLRSRVRGDLGDHALETADWQAATKALDAVAADGKQEAAYNLGEVMQRANDPRAESIWKYVISSPPPESTYAVDAWLRLSDAAQARGDYAQAIQALKSAQTLSLKVGGAMIEEDSNGQSKEVSNEDFFKNHLKELETLSAAHPAKAS